MFSNININITIYRVELLQSQEFCVHQNKIVPTWIEQSIINLNIN